MAKFVGLVFSTACQMAFQFSSGFVCYPTHPPSPPGDDESDASAELSQATPQRSERSHMIIWQNPSPPLPSPAL